MCEIFSGPWETSVQYQGDKRRENNNAIVNFCLFVLCSLIFCFRSSLPLNKHTIARISRLSNVFWRNSSSLVYPFPWWTPSTNLACSSPKSPPLFSFFPFLALLSKPKTRRGLDQVQIRTFSHKISFGRNVKSYPLIPIASLWLLLSSLSKFFFLPTGEQMDNSVQKWSMVCKLISNQSWVWLFAKFANSQTSCTVAFI